MPTYQEVTTAVTNGTPLENAISGKSYERSNKARVLKAVAATVLTNTPAIDDLTIEVLIGTVPVAKFNAGLDRTTGLMVQAEDYVPINLPVEPGTGIGIKVTNNDTVATHTCRLAVVTEGF